ncbi:MAG: hypothetical protein ACXQTT_03070, partial [Candidatus Syntropharchaeia archaeon]
KLIVAIDAENYELLGYELYDGCPNDAIILIPFLEKLHTSKKMRMGDVIICDNGFICLIFGRGSDKKRSRIGKGL